MLLSVWSPKLIRDSQPATVLILKKEFIDFQKQAATNFVEIIPEIDIPAHSLAFTHYKPEIGSKEYGMDHLDLFKPETYQFADNLFKRIPER